MKLSSAVEQISPELAAKMVKTATFQKRHKKETIREWAGMMKEGKWLLNGHPIIFNEYGQLIDGLGRLLALIESGTNQHLFVVRGVLHETTHTIDQGSRRKYIDRYVERGRPNVVLISNAISLYLRCKGKKSTRAAIGDFNEKTESDLQELANFSRKSMMLHRNTSASVIFAHALVHGIENTCAQLRKTKGNDTFSKLRGMHKLLALEKL